MASAPPKELCLSHATADAAFADRLAAVLRRHGVPVWFSRTDLLGGQQWHDEIGEALNRCDWFAVILSPRAMNSFWVKREVVFALQQPRYVQRITPIIMEPCPWEKFSWALRSYQAVSFAEGFEAGCRELLRVWGIGYKPL